MGSAADQPHDGDSLGRQLDELLAQINADEQSIDEAPTAGDAVSTEPSSDATQPEAAAVDDGPIVTTEPGAVSPQSADGDEFTPSEDVGEGAIAAAESLTADVESLSADIEALLQDQAASDAELATNPTCSDESEPAHDVDESPGPTLDTDESSLADDLDHVLAEVADSALGGSRDDAGSDESFEPLTAPAAGPDIGAPESRPPEPAEQTSAAVTAQLDESLGMEAAGLDGEAPLDDASHDDEGLVGRDRSPEPDTEPSADAAAESGATDTDDAGAAATEEIDDELAALSEALLSQDDDVAPEAVDAGEPATAARAAPSEADDANEAESPAPSVTSPESRPRPAGTPEPAHAHGRLRAIVEPIIARGAPAAATAVMAVSKPLENKPARVRHTVGWMAVYTAFMAACVWVWLIAFRSPVPPESVSGTPVEIAKPDAAAPGTDFQP